jgi:hypothetical protein
VDRHQLYEALFSALGAAGQGALEPSRGPQPDEETPVSNAGRGSPAGPRGLRAIGAGQIRLGKARSNRKEGADADHTAEQLPFDVLLATATHQMLVEQVTSAEICVAICDRSVRLLSRSRGCCSGVAPQSACSCMSAKRLPVLSTDTP